MARDVDAHVAIEDFEAVAALLLGAVHGEIGIAEELFGRLMLAAAERDPKAGPGLDSLATEVEGAAELGLDAPGDDAHIFDGADLVQQKGKLVAREAGGCVLRPDGGREPAGDFDQQGIAGGVPAGIVDFLELVDIEEDDAAALLVAARAAGHGELEAIEKKGAVGQAGQGVVERAVLEPRGVLLLVADIAVGVNVPECVAVTEQWRAGYGDIHGMAGAGKANGLDGGAAARLNLLAQQGMLLGMIGAETRGVLREGAGALAQQILRRKSEEAGELVVDVDN